MKKIEALVHDLGGKLSNGEIVLKKCVKELSNENPELLVLKQFYTEIVEEFKILKEEVYHQAREQEPSAVSILEYINKHMHLKEKYKTTHDIDIEILSDVQSNQTHVHMNPEHLTHLLDNIINNAVKANASKIIIEYRDKERTVELHVKDNGDGMTEKELEMIGFNYSTSGGGKGVEIIRDLAHSSGMIVNWHSIKGLGTDCFLKIKKKI